MLFHRHVVIEVHNVPQPGISYPEILLPLLFDDAAFIYNHYNRKDCTCCIICTVHFKSMYSSFLLILELKSINLAYCAIMQTSMIYLDLIHVIKISLKKVAYRKEMIVFFSGEILQWSEPPFVIFNDIMYLHKVPCWLLDYCTFHRLIILSIYFIYPSS